MILEKKLKYKPYINKIINNAQLATKTIYPFINKNCRVPQKMKLQLYNAYVRPILTNNAPIWSSAANFYIMKLQVVENKVLRIILNKKLEE